MGDTAQGDDPPTDRFDTLVPGLSATTSRTVTETDVVLLSLIHISEPTRPY